MNLRAIPTKPLNYNAVAIIDGGYRAAEALHCESMFLKLFLDFRAPVREDESK